MFMNVETNYKNNSKYLIKTINGWENFNGIIKTENANKKAIKITTENNKQIITTIDHTLFSNDNKIQSKNLSVGDLLDTIDGPEKIIKLEDTTIQNTYDIHNSDSHTILGNSIKSSNCDELSFVRNRIAQDFWASVFPTISCLSKDTVVLSQEHGYQQIKKYFDNKEIGDYFEMSNFNLWAKNGYEEVSHGYVSPESDTLIIKLENGQFVEVTHNHPLYCKRNKNAKMTKAINLKVGDHLRIEKFINYRGTKIVDINEYLSSCSYKPELILNVSEDCLENLLKGMAYIVYPKTRLERNYFILMLNNYGYNYDFKNGKIYVYDKEEKYKIQWVKIETIKSSKQEFTYDFTLPQTHSFIQNGILGSNTGGKCIITSTPSDDESLFAHMWKAANDNIDEYGNVQALGKNGFSPFMAKWTEHPIYNKDEKWKELMIGSIGEEKFRRECDLEFISEDETLINPIYLAHMEYIDPIDITNNVRWYKPINKDAIYIIGYDPSLGTGGDYSAIEIFEFPSMEQVGEWMHNKSDIPTQVKMLYNILKSFKELGFEEDNVRWTLENNTVGEAPLVLIQEYGLDNFFGYFMSEPYNPNVRYKKSRFRMGYNTTATSKLNACSRLKRLIEQDKMHIHSHPYVKELKSFISRGKTYAARQGEHDDLVMASLLVVRMAMEMMHEDEEYEDILGESIDDDDEWSRPLPVI